MSDIVTSQNPSTIVEVITPGPQGPAGPQGKDGAEDTITNVTYDDGLIQFDATGSLAFSGSVNISDITSSLVKTDQTSSMSVATASYALNAATSSYIENAISSSYALEATSASYALEASNADNATTSSFANTASYLNPLQQDLILTGSLDVSGSDMRIGVFETPGGSGNSFNISSTTQDIFISSKVNGTASLNSTFGVTKIDSSAGRVQLGELANIIELLTDVTASGNVSSSTTSTASFGTYLGDGSQLTGLETAQTASYVEIAQTASYVETAQTASYVETAQTASYVETAQTASYIEGANVDGAVDLANEADSLTINATGTNLSLSGDFAVAGTASFTNATNLAVTDKYILLASGSATPTDGGIVIEQAANGIGKIFGYDSNSSRWGITGSFNSNTAAGFTPDAYMSLVVDANNINNIDAQYEAPGNIFINASNVPYIYTNKWEKIILSGSNAELNNITTENIVASNVSASGHISASEFSGDGSGLTGISAFPFTGDAQITGSLTISGSFNAFRLNTTDVILGEGAGALSTINGPRNVFVGYQAGYSNTIGDDNVAVGYQAGYALHNNASDANVFIGKLAGAGGPSGAAIMSDANNNVGVGRQALLYLTTGDSNIAIGNTAMRGTGAAMSATQNIAIGEAALYKTDSGDNNIGIGYNAGYNQTTGNGNITIGSGSRGVAAESNQLRIGHEDVIAISGSLTTGDVIFYNTASAPNFSGSFQGDGSNIVGVISSSYALDSSTTISSSYALSSSQATTALTASSIIGSVNITKVVNVTVPTVNSNYPNAAINWYFQNNTFQKYTQTATNCKLRDSDLLFKTNKITADISITAIADNFNFLDWELRITNPLLASESYTILAYNDPGASSLITIGGTYGNFGPGWTYYEKANIDLDTNYFNNPSFGSALSEGQLELWLKNNNANGSLLTGCYVTIRST